ncbi:methyltransferase type 11 [Chlorella sorokiniana]|uniref:Methyltransferase type 11 n=1 Tax=Chlorella sorokiniana TaxID=3076 RepID=A0A2P6TWF6_CHLSO|nr:methyltransferase type 11 [Chlorella sorokiniana]|eukprot:PRW58392.1 methyltransferase type 11 [Chlorella sorokiniana]
MMSLRATTAPAAPYRASAPARRFAAAPRPARRLRIAQQRLQTRGLLGGGGDATLSVPPAEEAQAAAAVATKAADDSTLLRCDLEELKRRMDEVQAQLDQMGDRARAVSIAEAVRAAGEGDADLMTRLQHQQDDQLQEDENTWERIQDTFTQVMSKGYIQSAEKIRDRLLVTEWELSHKAVAMRRGVSQFELHCAQNQVDLPFETLTQLYEEPDNLDVIENCHLRMQCRASIRAAMDDEYFKVYAKCTEEAQKLAQQFSNTEFISKLLPESGVLEALKKVVPMALKLVV